MFGKKNVEVSISQFESNLKLKERKDLRKTRH